MLLEQILRNQEQLQEQKKGNVMKAGSVNEFDPNKTMRPRDLRPAKTLALKLDASIHDRLHVMSGRLNLKSKKAVARQALEYGLQMLEDRTARNK